MFRFLNTLYIVLLMLTAYAGASGTTMFSDNWNDLTVTGPSYAPMGAEWAVESGVFSANAVSPPPGFQTPESGKLMFQPYTTAAIHLNFGPTVPGTPVEARFKLSQSNNAEGWNACFIFGFKDSVSGKSHLEYASLNPAFYGSSGFITYAENGSFVADAPGQSLRNGWNYMRMVFDPAGYIKLWQAVDPIGNKAYTDPSLSYMLVAYWYNYSGMSNANQWYMDNEGGLISWKVDDVEIDFIADPPADGWMLKPDAVQTVYRNGVPHTDKNGNFRLSYDPTSSFLPLGLWYAWVGSQDNQTWSFSDFAGGGFNCVDLRQPLTVDVANAAQSAGVQIIKQYPTDADVNAVKSHPATLGWVLDDEPTPKTTPAVWQDYLTRRSQIRALGSNHPIFPVDAPAIFPPYRDEYITWNTSGELALHDNYPIKAGVNSLSYFTGIGETVSFTTSINNQNKPVWFLGQAFDDSVGGSGWVFPTDAQMRCMIYSSIIHGATGVFYFIMDSRYSRGSSIVGIAPATKSLANYGSYYVANNTQLRGSRRLWTTVSVLNGELTALRPVILSPTSSEPYEVYLDTSLTPVSWNPIRTILKTNPSGGLTLLLTNSDGVLQRARVRFPNRSFAVFEEYGNLGFTQSGDYIEIQCPAWDSRVLRVFFDTRSIWDAKNQTDGTVVTQGIVSAVFTDFFYIESSNRTFGIRVSKAGHGLSVGQVANVLGAVQTLVSGERCIEASGVGATGGSGIIAPLGLSNRSLGGGSLGLQQGVDGASGLSTIGLLVKTTGRVGVEGASWFMIDDGSGVSVKVYGDAPSGNPYVVVSGVSSCEKDSSNKTERVILATQVELF